MSSTNKTEHYNLPQFIGSDIPTWLGDFNSAMTAIDSGINAAATTASGAATTAAQALNRCPFPVGYGGFFHTDPNSIYAGTTWEQKKDVFILAAGDTYAVGSTGGEAEHTLSTEEMPAHGHNFYDFSKGYPREEYKSGIDDYITPLISSTLPPSTSGPGRDYYSGNTGGSKPHNNMPPYYAMPFWVRTA